MTNLVFLCLIIFLKLVLLAELPVVKERGRDELSNRREENPIMPEIERLFKSLESYKEMVKLKQDYDAFMNKGRRDLEKFTGLLEEIKKQIGQNDISSLEKAFNEMENDIDVLKNFCEREISEIEKRYSKFKKTEESGQITEDTDTERLGE